MIKLECQCDWLLGYELNGYRLSEEAIKAVYERLVGTPVQDTMIMDSEKIGVVTAVSPETNTFTLEVKDDPIFLDDEILALMRPALCLFSAPRPFEGVDYIERVEGIKFVGFSGKSDGEIGYVKRV